MKKGLKQLLLLISLSLLLSAPYFVFAQNSSTSTGPLDNLERVGSQSYETTSVDENTLISTIGQIINVCLGLLGIIFIVLIILAGFKWMTAQGSEEEVKSAKASLKTAIIGLIITLSAYAIWEFIATYLL